MNNPVTFSHALVSSLVLVLAFQAMNPSATAAQESTEAKLSQSDSLYLQYRKTETQEPLKKAAAILDALQQTESNNYQVAWRRARAYYHLGDDTKSSSEKLRLFDQAIQSATHATEINPGGVEGHYWLGACDGGYGQAKGMFKALSLIKSIRKEMENVNRIDPSYERAGGYVILGKMDFELPGLLGGSKKRAIQEYQEGLKLAPNNALLKVYLADSYIDAGQKDEAKALLEQVLAERGAESDPNLRDAQQEGRKLYAKEFK
jgi:tetratricopeptide (TPR) repeat protein